MAVVTVARKPHPREGASLANVRASIIPVATYPTLCGNAEGLSSNPVDVGDPPVSVMSVDNVDTLRGSFLLAPECSILTLAITNTNRNSASMDFDWSVTFEPTAAVLSSGVIELDVNRSGSTIAGGVGVRRVGDPDTDVLSSGCPCAAWGIADGTASGWVDTNLSAVLQARLGVSSFTSDGRTASVDSSLSAYVGSTCSGEP